MRFTSTYDDGVNSPFVLHGIAAFEKAFKTLEATLGDGRDWIFGDRYTLADINIMPYAARLVYLGLFDVWTEDRPHVQAWWGRASALPSFKDGISDRLSEQEYSDMATYGPAIRGPHTRTSRRTRGAIGALTADEAKAPRWVDTLA